MATATVTANGKARGVTVSRNESQRVPDKGKALVIPRLERRTFQLRLRGTSGLLVHAWSAKAKEMMLAKQMKTAKGGKAAKDPWEDYCESMYWLTPKPTGRKITQEDIDKAKFGFPALAFKNAATDACSFVDGVTKVEARGSFHVCGNFVEIIGKPVLDERMVRIAMGTADIRYRGMFDPWEVVLTVSYNAAALSPEQIANLFNVAGFGIGVGEHRPQCDGSLGMFEIAGVESK